jgi:hypothetical protein
VAEGQNGGKWKFWKWLIPLLIALAGFVIQFAVVPIIGFPESENNLSGRFWMSARDIPPMTLIYTVKEGGLPQSEYSPSFLYTLQIEQQLTFKNPMIWAPSKTYYAPFEDCELVRVIQAEHIEYRRVNETAVTLWPSAKCFNKRESSIELIWERSDCNADAVLVQSQSHEEGLRAQVTNSYDYPFQYLCVVKLPPLRTNTLYTIQDSPPELQASESLIIQAEGSDKTHSEIDFPLVMQLPEHMVVTFDIQILEQPPKILLVLQAPTPEPPITEMTPTWIWVVIGIVAALVIAMTMMLVSTRRSV